MPKADSKTIRQREKKMLKALHECLLDEPQASAVIIIANKDGVEIHTLNVDLLPGALLGIRALKQTVDEMLGRAALASTEAVGPMQ